MGIRSFIKKIYHNTFETKNKDKVNS